MAGIRAPHAVQIDRWTLLGPLPHRALLAQAPLRRLPQETPSRLSGLAVSPKQLTPRISCLSLPKELTCSKTHNLALTSRIAISGPDCVGGYRAVSASSGPVYYLYAIVILLTSDLKFLQHRKESGRTSNYQSLRAFTAMV